MTFFPEFAKPSLLKFYDTSYSAHTVTRPTDPEIAALLRELAASVTALTSSWGVTANVERKQAADARAMAARLENQS